MNLRNFPLLGLAILILTGCDDGPKPDYPTIKKIERSIIMPPGAHPLSAYERFYSFGNEYGHPVIWGSFYTKGMVPRAKDRFALPGDPVPASVHIVSEHHRVIVLDGGCDNVGLIYDLTNKSVHLACAGEA